MHTPTSTHKTKIVIGNWFGIGFLYSSGHFTTIIIIWKPKSISIWSDLQCLIPLLYVYMVVKDCHNNPFNLTSFDINIKSSNYFNQHIFYTIQFAWEKDGCIHIILFIWEITWNWDYVNAELSHKWGNNGEWIQSTLSWPHSVSWKKEQQQIYDCQFKIFYGQGCSNLNILWVNVEGTNL